MNEAPVTKFKRGDWTNPEPVIPGVPLSQRPDRELQEPLIGAGEFENIGAYSRAAAYYERSSGKNVDADMRRSIIEEVILSQYKKTSTGEIRTPLSSVDSEDLVKALPAGMKLAKDARGLYYLDYFKE